MRPQGWGRGCAIGFLPDIFMSSDVEIVELGGPSSRVFHFGIVHLPQNLRLDFFADVSRNHTQQQLLLNSHDDAPIVVTCVCVFLCVSLSVGEFPRVSVCVCVCVSDREGKKEREKERKKE